MPVHKMQLYVEAELWRKLEAERDRRHISMAGMVREVLSLWLAGDLMERRRREKVVGVNVAQPARTPPSFEFPAVR